MADIQISVEAGTKTRILTAGKYCADDILVTASSTAPNPPADGKTRLYIHVPENAMEGLPPPRADVPLYISQTVSGGVSIDWGDDSPAETITGTGNVSTTHHYSAGGDYAIALTVADGGCELGLGWSQNGLCVLGDTSSKARSYSCMLKHSVIGDGITSIDDYAFSYCSSLETVVLTESIESIGKNAFAFCYVLDDVKIPSTVRHVDTYSFYQCYSLTNMIIPGGIPYLNAYAFFQCYGLQTAILKNGPSSLEVAAFLSCMSLTSVIIPESITNIASSVFKENYSLKEVHILNPVPPRVQSDSFQGVPSDCIIYVPAGAVDAYKAATNWAALADHIQEEPAT